MKLVAQAIPIITMSLFHIAINYMKKVLIIVLLILAGLFVIGVIVDAAEAKTPRFEVFRTKNIFNLLLLDSRTGALWQVQYTLNSKKHEGDVQVSESVVFEGDGWNGRFTLTSTENIWTFLLADTKTGMMWHCQFTVDEKSYRGCYPIVSPKV